MSNSSSPRSRGDTSRASSTASDACTRQEAPLGSPPTTIGGDSLCQRSDKSNKKHRHMPYDRSPGGSSYTSESDDSMNADEYEEGVGGGKKIKRVQANCRERKRMHTVNSAFDQLRELVPTYPTNRKLSKIDTLRLACAYIQDLTSLVRNPTAVHGPGDDVKLYSQCGDGFLHSPPSCGSPTGIAYQNGVHVKVETAGYGTQPEYPTTCSTYQRYQHPSYFSDSSESGNTSPPYFPAQNCSLPGIAVRPPPLARTHSDSVALQMASTTIGSSSGYPYARSPVPSPLATVLHTPSSLISNGGGIPLSGHVSPPIWQRSGSVPSAYNCVYGQ